MIKELQTASRVICQRLRQRSYQKGVTITAWQAVIDQLIDGRRYGAFSWHSAVSKEVRRYIDELNEESKRTIWNASEDSKIVRDADLSTITECLFPLVFQATLPRIYRAVRYHETKSGEQDHDSERRD